MSEPKIDVDADGKIDILYFSIKRLERVLIHFNIIETLPYGRYKMAKRYVNRCEKK